MRGFPLLWILCAGCATSPEPSRRADADCIGMTLGEAIKELGLKLEKHPVIEEPPGIARGLECLSPAQEKVWLYFPRDAAEFNKRASWTPDILKKLTVVGIARLTPGGWVKVGTVIWYYHSN